jgi:hypothetical protein
MGGGDDQHNDYLIDSLSSLTMAGLDALGWGGRGDRDAQYIPQ